LLTTLGILWLDPPAALFAALATLVFMALAFFTQPVLQERDLRLRTQMGALSRFYLDAMLGLVPLKMHGAQRAFRREYEGLVHDWAGANWDLAQLANRLQALSVFVYAIIAVRLVLDFLARNGTTAGTLLFFFWILSLPVLATALVQAIQQYPMLRSLTLRVLEPLNAPDENPLAPGAVAPAPEEARDAGQAATGVAVSMDNVMVRLGGNVVLHNINLQIRPGEHVAIVGPSGAGKTTLVGLLLGWHAPSGGECRADGARVEGAQLQLLRRATVWVDPAIQLWNRTLWENVLYGNAPHALAAPARAIEEADLLPVVEQLDAGAETTLGESGGLVSGGEGQRVRLARGMARAGTRLVILDEPFRGLDRETRRKLLARARAFWKDVTLLCVTHDVNETRAFERVLVVEEGRIVEDAPPAQLEEKRDSRYRALLEGEQAVRTGLWAGPEWRRLWIQDGALQE
jgi:ATP-binding cassette subfamily B protein